MTGPQRAAWLDAAETLLREHGPREVWRNHRSLPPGLREVAGFAAAIALWRPPRFRLPRRRCGETSADPSVEALRLRCLAFTRRRTRQAVVRALERLVGMWPQLPVPKLALAAVLVVRKDRMEEAVRVAASASAEHPSSDVARLILASCLIRTGRYPDALEVLGGFDADARRWPGTHALRMFACMGLGDVEGALAAYRERNLAEGRRAFPRVVRAWLSLSRRRVPLAYTVLISLAWLATSGIGVDALWEELLFPGLLVLPNLALVLVAGHVTRARRPVGVVLLAVLLWAIGLWLF